MKLLLLLTTFFLIATDPDKTDRRGFFKKIRDAYIEGRMSVNEERPLTRHEKRILKRYYKEKVKRRRLFDRNVRSLVDGLSKRLKHRRSTVSIVVIGSVALVVWLCHKGSVGCDNHKERK